MREFDIVIDVKSECEEKKRKIDELIFEAFHGIGEFRLGINIINLESVSEQYKNFLTKTCLMDCYIITPRVMSDVEARENFLRIFRRIKENHKYVKFINMYDGEIVEEREATLEIVNEFISSRLGGYLYNMDISKDVYTNSRWLNKLKDEALELKRGTEIEITSLQEFLSEYDKMIQQKDSYTAEHSRAVCKFSSEIGKIIGLDSEQLKVLATGAALHDIGKYEIDIQILTKDKKLSDPEFLQIKNHPMIGKAILDAFVITELSKRDNEIVKLIVEQHHERFDGKGYPRKIDGSVIHEYSMIVSLADAFHAMLGRSYQNPRRKQEIIKNIRECSGGQFNPKYVDIFCYMIEKFPETFNLVEDMGYLRYVGTESIENIVISNK